MSGFNGIKNWIKGSGSAEKPKTVDTALEGELFITPDQEASAKGALVEDGAPSFVGPDGKYDWVAAENWISGQESTSQVLSETLAIVRAKAKEQRQPPLKKAA